jgi:hypothetical protein
MPSHGGSTVAQAASASAVKRRNGSVHIEETGSSWEGLVALRDEFDREAVAIPQLRSRIDGKPRDPAAKTVRLAEALAFDASWNRITDARNRRLAA